MTHVASYLLSAALLGLPNCGAEEMPRRVHDYAEAVPPPPAYVPTATVERTVRVRAELDERRTVQSVSCGEPPGPRFVCNVDFGGTCATYNARARPDGTVLVTRPPDTSYCITFTDGSGTLEEVGP